MPDVSFEVESAEAMAHAATPLLVFKLKVSQAGGGETPIHGIALRCQIRIEPTRRRYGPDEQERLLDLFGDPPRWGQTLRSMLWTHVNLNVPPFDAGTVVDLPVACSTDFNLGVTKYFEGLTDGDIPLCFLFSGTIFYPNERGGMQVAQISWEKEANFRLPVRVWREMVDLYYPNTAWLYLRKDVFDRLYSYKRRHSLPTWEDTVERLLAEKEAKEP